MKTLDYARRAYRERQLAGDDRAGIWARKRARNAQRRYVREHWRWMLLPVAVIIAVVSAASALVPSAYEKGFLLGGGLAGVGGLLANWVMQVTGTAPTMMGDLAEQWTAGELRKLRRKGWRVVNHLRLSTGDIDHVLIGPGGVFAIETKWSGTPWTAEFGNARIYEACRQVERNARDLRLWSEFNRAITPNEVVPVLVLWGAGTGQLEPAVSRMGPTTLVAGPATHEWRASLATNVLTPSQVEAAWRTLDKRAEVRDLRDDVLDPLPPSLYRLALIAMALVVTGVLGCVAGLQMLRLCGSIALGIASCVLLAVVAAAARRWKLGNYFALAWQSGVGFAILAIATDVVIH